MNFGIIIVVIIAIRWKKKALQHYDMESYATVPMQMQTFSKLKKKKKSASKNIWRGVDEAYLFYGERQVLEIMWARFRPGAVSPHNRSLK